VTTKYHRYRQWDAYDWDWLIHGLAVGDVLESRAEDDAEERPANDGEHDVLLSGLMFLHYRGPVFPTFLA